MNLEQMVAALAKANPGNEPMRLQWMARQFWPDADWLDLKCRNGGARRGALAAAGVAGRMARRGWLRRSADGSGVSSWQLVRTGVL